MVFTIQEARKRLAARGFTVSEDRIRRWVGAGLVQAEVRGNRYRYFSDMDVAQMALVAALQDLGYTVAEIGYLVNLPVGKVRDKVMAEFLGEARKKTARADTLAEGLRKGEQRRDAR